MKNYPLIVDLDGTLIKTDMLLESLVLFLKNKPYLFFLLPLWLFRGKAYLKERLSFYTKNIGIKVLPYEKEVIEFIKKEKKKRKVELVSASNNEIVKKIAKYLDLFDHFKGSDYNFNLSAHNKLGYLEKRHKNGFDYIGNSQKDICIWQKAKNAYAVNASDSVIKTAKNKKIDLKIIKNRSNNFMKYFLKSLRPHQWSKNLLIFAIFFLTINKSNITDFINLFMAFLTFSMFASGAYIVNDLVDLEADRKHKNKNKRPFASGRLSILVGIITVPALYIAGFFIAKEVGASFVLVAFSYILLTFLYSLLLKRFAVIDVVFLSLLYLVRIYAGAVVIDAYISPWFIAFASCFFLSLAFAKRVVEIDGNKDNKKLSGRGYITEDRSFLYNSGLTFGIFSICIFLIYGILDISPVFKSGLQLIIVISLLTLWVMYFWFKVTRKKMQDDPVLFAVKEPVALFIEALVLLTLLAGLIGL